MKKQVSWVDALIAKDLIKFPEKLNKKSTEEEFLKKMTPPNSEIPIEDVNFIEYPGNI